MYHDSYEYRSDWAPGLFTSFAKRRGYDLKTELPALFAEERAGTNDDHVARVKSDYRETVSDVMAEESLPMWVNWSHAHGFVTRNEAHGSPGNLLDLYAVADIPETEMFYRDHNKLVSKFASAAAHVAGRNLTAAETGTWLKEHFTETLADMKYLLDDLFLSGVNHVIYHGTCYSPAEAGWPGWHFYASYEMNPRNSVWRDVPALNSYVAHCQSILQSDRPANDLLLYWPIHDFWHNAAGRVQPMTVHGRGWFEAQPIGKTAEHLWNRGYSFDYVSDHQLQKAIVTKGLIKTPGAAYRAIVVPPAVHLPVATFRKLLALAEEGGTVIFEKALPNDVPGWANLEARRAEFRQLAARLQFGTTGRDGLREARLGSGRVLVGDLLEAALSLAGIRREIMFDRPGLMCIRRSAEDAMTYFIANRSDSAKIKDWITLATEAKSVLVMDPLTGRTGSGALRQGRDGRPEVYLHLEPGESIVLRCSTQSESSAPKWTWREGSGRPVELAGTWQVKFLEGGPELPAPFQTQRLESWTVIGDTNAQRFAGTALYSLNFDRPPQAEGPWQLDLGKVYQSARVRLNGESLGTLITPPFHVIVPALKPKGNRLEIEVTNVTANRIRDLDLRGVSWKTYYDINFVNLEYKPFDASTWPLTDSGLLGPVTLTPVATGPAP